MSQELNLTKMIKITKDGVWGGMPRPIHMNEDTSNRSEPARLEPGRFVAADLFGAGNEIIIEHNSEEYRLRITSNGKLILTK